MLLLAMDLDQMRRLICREVLESSKVLDTLPKLVAAGISWREFAASLETLAGDYKRRCVGGKYPDIAKEILVDCEALRRYCLDVADTKMPAPKNAITTLGHPSVAAYKTAVLATWDS